MCQFAVIVETTKQFHHTFFYLLFHCRCIILKQCYYVLNFLSFENIAYSYNVFQPCPTIITSLQHYLPSVSPHHLPLNFMSSVIFVLVVIDNPMSQVSASHVYMSDPLAALPQRKMTLLPSATINYHGMTNFMMSFAICKALCFLSLTFWTSVRLCLRKLLLTCEYTTQLQLLLRSALLKEMNKVRCIYFFIPLSPFSFHFLFQMFLSYFRLVFLLLCLLVLAKLRPLISLQIVYSSTN